MNSRSAEMAAGSYGAFPYQLNPNMSGGDYCSNMSVL